MMNGMKKKEDGDGFAMEHAELTERIIKCCYEVANELGVGFVESVYKKALLQALRDAGMAAREEIPLRVMFRGQCVGEFFADILAEEKVIIELKAVRALAPEHVAQVLNYLNATGLPIGMLVNFGTSRIEIRRLRRQGKD